MALDIKFSQHNHWTSIHSSDVQTSICILIMSRQCLDTCQTLLDVQTLIRHPYTHVDANQISRQCTDTHQSLEDPSGHTLDVWTPVGCPDICCVECFYVCMNACLMPAYPFAHPPEIWTPALTNVYMYVCVGTYVKILPSSGNILT